MTEIQQPPLIPMMEWLLAIVRAVTAARERARKGATE